MCLPDRGRPPATRVLAEPLPRGHSPLWIALTKRDQVRPAPVSPFKDTFSTSLSSQNCIYTCILSTASVSPSTVFPNLLPTHPEAAHHTQHAIKHENYYVPYCYSGNLQGAKTVCSGEDTDFSSYFILFVSRT